MTPDTHLRDVAAALVARAAALAGAPDLRGRRVLLRLDLNCPITPAGELGDDYRIAAALPTLRLLLAKGARVAVASHLGRPKPGARRPQDSLAPVAARLAQLLPEGAFTGLAPDCVGPAAAAAIAALRDGQACLLENLRLHAGEAANDPAFAAQLAELADVYVGDAFGAAHRDQASVTGITRLVPACYPGLLIAKEMQNYLATMVTPRRPMGVVFGGAKVKDKIGVLRSLLAAAQRGDVVCVGGRMAFTFLAARGVSVGATQIEPEWVGPAREMVETAAARGVQLVLPCDVIVSGSADEPQDVRTIPLTSTCCSPEAPCLPPGTLGLDIGPAACAAFSEALAGAQTVLWNGPMGRYEVPEFSAGTSHMIEFMVAATARGVTTVVGGGDSLAALTRAGAASKVGFASTGGGASLELLEGARMPGLRALATPRPATAAAALPAATSPAAEAAEAGPGRAAGGPATHTSEGRSSAACAGDGAPTPARSRGARCGGGAAAPAPTLFMCPVGWYPGCC